MNQEAQTIEAASAESAAAAKAAADAAVALREDMRNKQSELQTQITAVNARYAMLPPPSRMRCPPCRCRSWQRWARWGPSLRSG